MINQSFAASLVHNVLALRKAQITAQISPFAKGFISEGRIMDNFELAICFEILFDTSYFSLDCIAFDFNF